MHQNDKNEERLAAELEQLRQQILESERQEITRKRIEDQLRESEERYRSLVDSTEDSIYLVDRNCRYLFMNKKHLLRLGLLGDQFLGQLYRQFHSPQETKEFIKKVDHVFKTGESVQYQHKSRRDGRCFLRTLSPVKERDGRTTAVTVVSKDISELKEMEEKFHALSLTDELTGLYNRRGFLTLAEQQMQTAKRLRCGTILLTADVDNLKRINDMFGHQEGDFALMETARILRKTFREPDIKARMSGDEFAVLMLENTVSDSEALIGRLQKELDIRNGAAERSYKVSLSIGIARRTPECNSAVDELLREADTMMYENKRRRQSK